MEKDPTTNNSSITKEKPENIEGLEPHLIPENPDWDQFEENKKKFNVQSDYDFNLYTTKLDMETITQETKEKAEKIERVSCCDKIGNSW